MGKKLINNIFFKLTLLFGIIVVVILAILLINKNLIFKSKRGTEVSPWAGYQSCIECHEKEVDEWKMSHHYKAMQVANDTTILGDFNNASFTSKGITSEFFKNDSNYFVTTQGSEGEYQTYQIVYTFGYFPLQQYIVEFPRGRYQCLHMAWDSEKNKWFDLYPDLEILPNDWLHWTKGAQTWNGMCADCHSTDLHKNYVMDNDSFHTSYEFINVSCEACHGPLEEHVRLSRQYPDSNVTFGTVYLPALSDQEQLTQQCVRCHSRRSQIVNDYSHDDDWLNQYIPQILMPNLYHADGQILDEVYVWGSFVQSKMYHNYVACTDCHNAHTYQIKFEGNRLCTQCHVPQIYDAKKHHFHDMAQEGSSCIECHMPGRYYMGNDFRRDHSLRVPRPDLSVKYGVPNSCNTAACHADQTNEWSRDTVIEWYGPERAWHFSDVLVKAANGESSVKELKNLIQNDTVADIARATAVYYLEYYAGEEAREVAISSLNDKSALVRRTAINNLNIYPVNTIYNKIIPRLSDSMRMVRLAAFNALAGADLNQFSVNVKEKYEKAKEEFYDYFKTNAEFPGMHQAIGQYYHRNGELDKAEQYYRKSLEIDNYTNAARVNLAFILNSQQKNDEAMKLLQKVIEQEPGYDQAYYLLGLLYAEINKQDSAAYFLSQSIEINASNLRAYYNLGLLYQQLGKSKEAENTFKKGLVQFPESEELLYALAYFYSTTSQIEKSIKTTEKLLSLYPQNPDYQQFYSIIKQQ
ncbi:tetratricopeptide repeat protein [Bacteroidota bacterium]